jgi:iron complex transport system substrate-binding protein
LPRIVSLIASATEIVHALGEFDHLVGRSHECDFPPQVLSLPVCTEPRIAVDGDSAEIDRLVKEAMHEAVSVYRVFDDVLEKLQPTHIVTQAHCEVCAVSLRDVESAMARAPLGNPTIVSLSPNSLGDIWNDIRRVARSLDLEQRGEGLIARLQGRMREISARALAAPERPRVACLEWLEPVMPVANWMPELIEMAGGVNERLENDPDVIIAMPCGFDLRRTESEMHWLARRPEWAGLRAVRSRQVYAADGNQYFNRPGPRVVESLEILAEILHPALRLAYTETCVSDSLSSSRWSCWPAADR